MVRQKDAALLEWMPSAIRTPIIEAMKRLSRRFFSHSWLYDPVDAFLEWKARAEMYERHCSAPPECIREAIEQGRVGCALYPDE